jgi:hypothetical protein
MMHFDITEWADFVLNTAPAEKRSAMAAHIESGCPECSQLRSVLEEVRHLAAAEMRYEPPADLVGAVTGIARARERKRPQFRRLVAALIYDSFANLQPEGARGSRPAARQFAFIAGDYHLELQVERSRSQVTLVGQFGWDDPRQAGINGLPVLLVAGSAVIAQSVTNDFGEFCLEYRDRTKLRLCIPLETQGTQIEVPLTQLES